MTSKLLELALKLTESERVLLVEQIWDSLAEKQQGPDLTSTQTMDLIQRLDRLKRTGPAGSTWDADKAHLKNSKLVE